MAALNRERIVQILGDLDDHTMARILDTGATESDLREAVRYTEQDVREGEAAPGSRNAAVTKLCAILSRIAVEEDLADSELH
jgi:hypothetical protein